MLFYAIVPDSSVRSAFHGLQTVRVDDLRRELRFGQDVQYPARWMKRPVSEWTMESDDLVLRYIFRNFRPDRHLEFGTWEGDGVLRCVEECDASVWTINLLEGETKDDGQWAYGTEERLVGTASRRGERLVTAETTWIRTDAYGLIGHKYLSRHLGHRVCQIYCDSRTWDISKYPDGFFDTAFVDGGHVADVVQCDTWNALALVRPAGLVLWHDFCPRSDAHKASPTSARVTNHLRAEWAELSRYFDRLFWVEPSWLLVGVRNAAPVERRRPITPG
jgi:Methyltransferase domain